MVIYQSTHNNMEKLLIFVVHMYMYMYMVSIRMRTQCRVIPTNIFQHKNLVT